MTEIGTTGMIIQVLAGLSLAACCGLRAFLPPFVLGLAVRLGATDLIFGNTFTLHPSFQWLSSTPALIVFGAAVVFETLADKVPVVDHLLDLVETAVRPLAGLLVLAASLAELEPLPAAVVGLLVGGAAAGGVHLGKSKIRILSTLGTGGLASPLISFFEDLAALVGSVLAMLASVVAVVVIALGVGVTVYLLRRFYLRVGRLRRDLRGG
ncbi:MAG TPA: DUF4126 domain-containing protein [Acidobacteria bacterium]|nr:DUF4126 domain-containing protein [Acidobacteriota bacterium]